MPAIPGADSSLVFSECFTSLCGVFAVDSHLQGDAMTTCTSNHVFHNWAQTISCKPAQYCRPKTESEVQQFVQQAVIDGKHVRTVGAGHSWAPLVLTEDSLINLDHLNQVNTDIPNRLARAQAGIRLKDLTPRLATDKLALANLGSIREQSIAGAISTGTHGTGLGLGILATQIVGMRLVTGTGDVISITTADQDLLRAARVSLGALGIVNRGYDPVCARLRSGIYSLRVYF